MAAIINIGLKTNDGTAPLGPHDVASAFAQCAPGARILDWKLAESNTEPTVVAILTRPLSGEEGYNLACVLHQDCIAQRADFGDGELIGPHADKWAPFNPDYFLEI